MRQSVDRHVHRALPARRHRALPARVQTAPPATDAVKQLLRELIDRVEITPDRRAYPYFWVPASCDPAPTTDERGPNAQPAPSHQEDTGWPFMTNREVFTFGPDQVFCGVIGAPPTG